MWNDLNMRDRHKLIRLAVTNGIYDLDTIHSLYDNNEYKDGGIIENRRKKDTTEEEVVNVDNQHDYKRIHWDEVDKSPTGNTAYGDVYQIRQPKDRKDFLALKKDIRENYPDAKIFVKNGINYFRVPHILEEQPSTEIANNYTPEIANVTYTRPNERKYLNYLPEIKKINIPIPTRNSTGLFLNGKLEQNGHFVNEGDEEELQNIASRLGEGVANAVLGRAWISSKKHLTTITKDENNIKRNAFIKELNDAKKFANIINGYSVGGELPTEPNRTLPSVDRTIEMLRMKALEKALMEQSQNIPDVIPVNDAIAYNYAKPYVAPQPETVNLTDVLNTPVIHPMSRKPGISLNTNGYCRGGKLRY